MIETLFTFAGRIGRLGFWGRLLLIALIGGAIAAAVGAIVGSLTGFDSTPAERDLPHEGIVIVGFISLTVYLAVVVASLSVYVRRLHDLGRSGKWMLLVAPLNALGGALANTQDPNPAVQGTALVVSVINLAILIYIGFFPGQRGGNRFGPDPRAAKG